MTSNVEAIVQEVHADFQKLVSYVTGAESAQQSAYTVELTLFRSLLALGRSLLRLFFEQRAAVRPAAPQAADGRALVYHERRPTSYYSVFGKVSFKRHYFHRPGQAGVYPLDEQLSLPARSYSALLQEWASYGASDLSYGATQHLLERMLGLPLSVQALERISQEAAPDVNTFYQQAPPPAAPAASGTILVVQADGKGVPLVQPPARVRRVRLGKGQKHGKKKEAVVTTLYTIAPYARSAQEVVAALLDETRPADPPHRPQPVAKEVRATLDGKATALQRLQGRASQREHTALTGRVALTDGAESLQQLMQAHFPTFSLVLDIIHASEYLWSCATALYGEASPLRTPWVRDHLTRLLDGQVTTVIRDLEARAAAPTTSPSQQSVLLRTVGYYQRNQPYMRYDTYLAQGWPIGTGVVEGACGHLVKDRMEQAGMRWRVAGANAILDLRAVRLNDHWTPYWHFHRRAEHRRLYGSYPASDLDACEQKLFKPAA